MATKKKPVRRKKSAAAKSPASQLAPPKPSAPPATKAGRPRGSKTQKAAGKSTTSKCPKCGSTDRTPYSQTRAIAIAGVDPDFGSYTHVVKRWTKCKSCNQARTDHSLENRR